MHTAIAKSSFFGQTWAAIQSRSFCSASSRMVDLSSLSRLANSLYGRRTIFSHSAICHYHHHIHHSSHFMVQPLQSCPKLWHERLLQMFRCAAFSGEDIGTFTTTFHAMILGSSVNYTNRVCMNISFLSLSRLVCIEFIILVIKKWMKILTYPIYPQDKLCHWARCQKYYHCCYQLWHNW